MLSSVFLYKSISRPFGSILTVLLLSILVVYINLFIYCGVNRKTSLCPSGIAFSTAAEEIYVTGKDGNPLLFCLIETDFYCYFQKKFIRPADKWCNCIRVFDKGGDYVRCRCTKGPSVPGHCSSPEDSVLLSEDSEASSTSATLATIQCRCYAKYILFCLFLLII